MAEAQLSVELTAKIDGLRDNFNAAIREVGKLDKDTRAKLQSIDKGFADLANSAETNFSGKIAGSAKKASSSVSKDLATLAKNSAVSGQGVAAGSNKAAFALTNLGRVAQDAPFGFMGIQNNLNPLLESFQQLQKESGSTGGALKALAGSLMGAGGLGLALSLVSAGVLLYQKYMQDSNKETKAALDINKDYADTLSAVDRAQLKGAQAADATLIPLKALYEATQNTSLSLGERKKAVDSLQEQYPAYFKNISDEIILAGGAEKAYLKLTAAIVAKAKASAVEDEIKDNAKLQRTLDKRAENNKKATEDARKNQAIDFAIASKNAEQLAALRKKNPIKSLSDINPNPDIRNKGENGEAGDIKTVNELTAEGIGIQNQKNIAKNEEIKLSNVLKGIIESDGVDAILPDKTGSLDTTTKKIRTLSDVLKDLNIDLLQAANNGSGTFGDQQKEEVNAYQKAIDDLIKMGFNPASDAILKLKAAQKDLFSKDALGNKLLGDTTPLSGNKIASDTKPIQAAPILDFTPIIVGKSDLDKALDDLKAKKDEFLSLGNIMKMTSGTLADGFAAIGTSMANGGNVIEAFGQVIINAFGNFLAELGRQTIAEGLYHIAKGVAYASNPFTAALAAGEFATGGGLVAAGGLLSVGGGLLGSVKAGGGSSSGGAQKPTAFANGGVIYGPTLGLMGEYAGAKSDPEVVAPLSKLKAILGQHDDTTLTTSQSRQASTGNVFNSTTNSYGSNGTTPTINVHAPQPIVIVPEFKMRGRDMYLMFKQEEAKQKRI